MGMTGTTSQPSMGTSMKGTTSTPQTMKGTQMSGQPQAGGIVQGNPGLMGGLYTGQGQGFNGIGQGFQGAQGMTAPGSSYANPSNPALGGGMSGAPTPLNGNAGSVIRYTGGTT